VARRSSLRLRGAGWPAGGDGQLGPADLNLQWWEEQGRGVAPSPFPPLRVAAVRAWAPQPPTVSAPLLLLRRRGWPGGRTQLGAQAGAPSLSGAQAAAPREDESQPDVGRLRSHACFSSCCKRTFHVFRTFVNDVASVSYGC
jgi:hypothetical protein